MTDFEMLEACKKAPYAFTVVFPVLDEMGEIQRLEIKNPYFDELKSIENLEKIRSEWDATKQAPISTRIRNRLFPWANRK